jgi:putative transposase
MDRCSRKIIGWDLSRKIDEELACTALLMAIERRKPGPGIIHHSERGVQYCSMKYRAILSKAGIRSSSSRKGNPYDNAAMERFMRTLKQEEVYLNCYETIEDVIENVPSFIEEVYNNKRVHSSLGYLTSDEFEEKNRQLQDSHPELKLGLPSSRRSTVQYEMRTILVILLMLKRHFLLFKDSLFFNYLWN